MGRLFLHCFIRFLSARLPLCCFQASLLTQRERVLVTDVMPAVVSACMLRIETACH